MGLGVGWGLKFRTTIEPVPVLVTFSITVGASLEFSANFHFEPEDGEEYPCLDKTAPCIEPVSTPATFANASKECSLRGGRLAELGSESEALRS
jgi:hypothetical protein